VNGETRERLGQSVKRAPQFVGRPEGELRGRRTSAGSGISESRDFLPARFRV
jgi:hypothetical protein